MWTALGVGEAVRLGRIGSVVSVVGMLSCYQAPEFEEAPATSVQWSTYESPTLDIDPEQTEAVSRALFEQLEAYRQVCGWDSEFQVECESSRDVCDSCAILGELREPLEYFAEGVEYTSDGATIGDQGRPSDLGIARLAAACIDGRFDARVRFGLSGLGPAVWGRFSACRFPESLDSVVLDGGFRIDFGRPFINPLVVDDWVRFEADELLESDEGRIFNLRWRPLTGDVEFRFEVEDDEGVVFLNSRGGGVRDADTLWICDFMERECTSEDGQFSLDD